MNEVSFTEQDVKPWAPYAPMMEYVGSLAASSQRVLDVGAGNNPFSRATHVVDLFPRSIPNVISQQVNFRKRELPYDDNYFDFVFCRHTLEDMDDPSRLAAEIQRVGKRGYIETPSPLAEVSRGIDGGSPAWRGYSHHRHLIWQDDGKLHFLPKLSQIEHIALDDRENVKTLRDAPWLANTYFFWNRTFDVHFVWDKLLTDFEKGQEVQTYRDLVIEAVSKGITSSKRALQPVLAQ